MCLGSSWWAIFLPTDAREAAAQYHVMFCSHRVRAKHQLLVTPVVVYRKALVIMLWPCALAHPHPHAPLLRQLGQR